MPAIVDRIISGLRAAGVTRLFGVPGGGSNLELIESAARGGLPFTLTATETAGALAAIAQAELTGTPGACLTTIGPGAASVVNGVACAFLDRAPLVVFTDAPPAQFPHQRVDQRAVLRPITKWSAAVTAENATQVLECALKVATTWPPGPVHLDCAWDDAAAIDVGQAPPSAAPSQPLAPHDADALVSRASRPLLLVGLGARRAADASAIAEFCERHHVPALVTYKAKGVVADGSGWFGGVFTDGAIERPIVDEADLLIGIGLDPVELLPRPWTHAQPIVYYGPGPIVPAHVPFAACVFDEVPAALERIASRLGVTSWNASRVRAHVDSARTHVRSAPAALTPDRAVEIVGGRLAATHRVTLDAGAHMFPATMLWPAAAPGDFLISNGLSTMGFALPAAIGAALLDRERPVVALTGDAGLLMCVGELLTASRERLRIIVVVFDDATLSLIDVKQRQRHFGPSGVCLGAVAWPALAESMGVAAFSAATAGELEGAVERALPVDGPTLIAARIDPSDYGRILKTIRG